MSILPQAWLETTVPFLKRFFMSIQGRHDTLRQTNLLTTARRSSTKSKYTSLLLYFMPSFRQGIGEAKGFEPALDTPGIPATESILESKEGGSTISRSAFFSVVSGCPLSSISSSSCHCQNKFRLLRQSTVPGKQHRSDHEE